jgi:hypothetical protein
MLWYAAILALLFTTSIIALAAAGAGPRRGASPFVDASLEEQRLHRRSARLQALGFTSLAVAALLGLFGLAAGMSMLH